MLTFIDESGSFTVPLADQRNLSCVGALVVPETVHNELIEAFVKLRSTWAGTPQEVKGSKLQEYQTAKVIDLLSERGCLFFVCATEMSLNSDAMIADLQRKQAECITENISNAHHPLLRRQLFELHQAFEKMPAQLFLQSVLLTDLIRKVIDLSGIHFAMQKPSEIGAFRWYIDSKVYA